MSSSIEIARHTLLSCGLILAIGTIAAFVAQKIRIPDVAVFLVTGIAIGPHALGFVQIGADSALNQIILLFGASYILFDGGATLRLAVLKQVWITILVIATVGIVITAAITGFAAHVILGIPLIVAFLLAATIASTDPATLVPIFRQVHIRDRVAQTVMSESAFNDAMGAIITFSILGVATGSTFSLSASLFGLIEHSVIGIVAGIVLGTLAALLIAHEKWAFLAEYAPVVTVVAVIGAYFAAEGMHASGFMAVFVFGIVLGNKESFGFRMEPGEAERLDEFVLTTAFILRLFIFILLGAQVDFALMKQYWLDGVAVTLVLMFVARPATVFLCALPDRRARWSFAEMLFMCWTRETGVIPAALAGLLLGMKAPGAEMIASVTFIAILMTILIQASTTRWLAQRLGLLETKPH
ncbi:pesticidal protein Cry5Ba [Bradyrhizobium sp. LTSP885]|uniref:cation:proton antiporter n=1 Tax=Bradyrhizobium sp. LTSP885 TaxID=1619232 RepID=UPI0005C85668|nr:sodium:proton antiporter [Bradyrhizobium sp. LTSP885]KJC35402.1 pesticidal protein Cry5Ba [Bradyrhizobium sp. LTSP885]